MRNQPGTSRNPAEYHGHTRDVSHPSMIQAYLWGQIRADKPGILDVFVERSAIETGSGVAADDR